MAAIDPFKAASAAKEDKKKSEMLPLFKSLPDDTIELTVSFLHTTELAQLCKTSRFFHQLFAKEMAEKKKVSQELVSCVFKAEPAMVAKFFAKPDVKADMVLTKSCHNEGYFSKKLNKFVTVRRWGAVSPLQAAARCLDNFLVIKLLAYIEKDEKLRLQAAEQLTDVLRKTIKDSAKSVSTKAMGTSSSDSSSESKVKEESKGIAQSPLVEYADCAEYGAPFKALLKAYNDYITQYPRLSSEGKWDELDTLWGVVGECHKRLPTYGLQEYFDDKPFSPLPEFNTEPKRGECRYWNNTLLDLDELGAGGSFALYKGAGTRGAARVASGAGGGGVAVGRFAQLDSSAICRLFELRQAELENTIACLLTPGVAITQGRADKAVGSKP